MLVLADGVTRFLEKNRMYEVLGLFILLIVGVVLLGKDRVTELAHAMQPNYATWQALITIKKQVMMRDEQHLA